MAKFLLSIIIVAVLLGGISTDLICLLMETMHITPDLFITYPDRACRDLNTKFNQARQEFQNCLGFEVDISNLVSLHNEFCTPNSNFRKYVDRQRHCIKSNLPRSINCLSVMEESSNLEHPDNFIKRSIYEMCQSISVEISECLAKKVGGPCGPEGQEVYSRIAEASEPFFTASCFSLAKLAVAESELEIEEEKEAEKQKATFNKSNHYPKAAATVHCPIMWFILLGLLFTSNWW